MKIMKHFTEFEESEQELLYVFHLHFRCVYTAVSLRQEHVTLLYIIQVCVQRSLSAKNMSHAKAGVVLAAYLKVLSFAFFIIPGMISRVLYPGEIDNTIDGT